MYKIDSVIYVSTIIQPTDIFPAQFCHIFQLASPEQSILLFIEIFFTRFLLIIS